MKDTQRIFEFIDDDLKNATNLVYIDILEDVIEGIEARIDGMRHELEEDD